jgi:hypothetical protein
LATAKTAFLKMKVRMTLPKNTAFFNRYADLVYSLKKSGIIAQLIAGLTEIGILMAIVYGSIVDMMPIFAPSVSVIGAIVAASMLQIGLRVSLPYAVRSVLFRRFTGLDLAFSLVVWLLLVALLVVSVTLSYRGSKDIAQAIAPKPKERTTTASDSLARTDAAQVESIYTVECSNVAARYGGKIEATKANLQMEIESLESAANRYLAKSPTHAKELKARAKVTRGTLAAKVATLTSEQAAAMETANAKRADQLAAIQKRRNGEADQVSSENRNNWQKAETKANQYGGYLGFFALACYLVFIVSVVLDEMLKKGAKIQAMPMPTQYNFTPSVFQELKAAFNERFNQVARAKIQTFADKTKAAPIPSRVPILYSYEADHFKNVLTVEAEQSRKSISVKLPTKSPLQVAASTTAENAENGNEETKRRIGFYTDRKEADGKKGQNEVNENRNTKAVNDYSARTCGHCESAYTHKHHKQIYCSENCRVLAWEKRTGRTLNKGKV